MRDNQPVRKNPAPGDGQISCAICLNQSGDQIAATTIIHGYAVCSKHIDLASQPEFDIFTLHGTRVRPV